MDSASGSPASCISTVANMWSAVTKRVSVVPVIVTGTRGTTGTPDVDVDDEVELVDVELDELVEVVVEPPVDVEGPLEQAENAAATGAPKAAT